MMVVTEWVPFLGEMLNQIFNSVFRKIKKQKLYIMKIKNNKVKNFDLPKSKVVSLVTKFLKHSKTKVSAFLKYSFPTNKTCI